MRLDINHDVWHSKRRQDDNEVWGKRAHRGPPRNWDMTTHCWSRGSRIHRGLAFRLAGRPLCWNVLRGPVRILYPGGARTGWERKSPTRLGREIGQSWAGGEESGMRWIHTSGGRQIYTLDQEEPIQGSTEGRLAAWVIYQAGDGRCRGTRVPRWADPGT